MGEKVYEKTINGTQLLVTRYSRGISKGVGYQITVGVCSLQLTEAQFERFLLICGRYFPKRRKM